MALSDGSPFQLPRPQVEDGTVMEGAAGVQSSVNDLLKYSRILMETAAAQELDQADQIFSSTFKQFHVILRGHIDLFSGGSDREQSYALGWIRTMLPCPLGTCGLNPIYVETMPPVGKGMDNQELVIHH